MYMRWIRGGQRESKGIPKNLEARWNFFQIKSFVIISIDGEGWFRENGKCIHLYHWVVITFFLFSIWCNSSFPQMLWLNICIFICFYQDLVGIFQVFSKSREGRNKRRQPVEACHSWKIPFLEHPWPLGLHLHLSC